MLKRRKRKKVEPPFQFKSDIPSDVSHLPPELQDRIQRYLRICKREREPFTFVDEMKGGLVLDIQITQEETVGGPRYATYWTARVKPRFNVSLSAFHVEIQPRWKPAGTKRRIQ